MKNRNLKSIFALALSAILFAAVLTPAALAGDESADTAESAKAAAADTLRPGRNRRSELAEPENAIGKDAAVARALAEVGISAEQAGDITVRVTENADGSIVYRVRFTADGQRYSAEVDAVSGELLCLGARDASDVGRGQGQSRRGDGQGQKQRGDGQDQSNGGRSGSERGSGQKQRGGKCDGSCLDPESTAAA